MDIEAATRFDIIRALRCMMRFIIFRDIRYFDITPMGALLRQRCHDARALLLYRATAAAYAYTYMLSRAMTSRSSNAALPYAHSFTYCRLPISRSIS